MAHWITTSHAWTNFGYRDDDVPEVTDDHRERLRRADELTNQLMVPAFSVLDGTEPQRCWQASPR